MTELKYVSAKQKIKLPRLHLLTRFYFTTVWTSDVLPGRLDGTQVHVQLHVLSQFSVCLFNISELIEYEQTSGVTFCSDIFCSLFPAACSMIGDCHAPVLTLGLSIWPDL